MGAWHFYGSWAGMLGLGPGQAHHWAMWGFKVDDAVTVSAHPIVGDPYAGERILEVEHARIEGDPSGWRLYFTVRNVGQSYIPGYGLGFGVITP